MGSTATVRMLVLVEGRSDAAAVRAVADLLGCDLVLHHIQIWSADGVTNFSQLLVEFARSHPDAKLCGMYDVADERHVRRALTHADITVAAHESLESFGFFACIADLEDELIRALGTEAVESVLEEQGELVSFRRFQAMPQHRTSRAPTWGRLGNGISVRESFGRWHAAMGQMCLSGLRARGQGRTNSPREPTRALARVAQRRS